MSALTRGAFVAGSLAAATAPALAADLTTVRVAGSPDSDIVGAMWGVKSGIFQRDGLDVQITRMNSGSAVVAATIGGSVDIGKSSTLNLINAHLKGVPILVEAVSSIYSSDHPTLAFVVGKNAPFKTARDFSGKTLAVASLGDLFGLATIAWLEANGAEPKSIKTVEIPTNVAATAIAEGRVDGATMVYPILADAVQSGKCRIFGYPYDIVAKKFGVTFYFCTKDYAAKNADLLARFRKDLATAVSYAMAHRDEMVPLASQYTGIDPQLVRATPDILAVGLDPNMIQPLIDFAAKNKLIANAFPAAEMIDPAALRT